MTGVQTCALPILRTELAATNEQLARQAQHFMEEMRRLGAGTLPASGSARRATSAVERRAPSLTQRITEAKPELALGVSGISRPVLVKSDAALAAVTTPAPATSVQKLDEPKTEIAAAETVAVDNDAVAKDIVEFVKDEQTDLATSNVGEPSAAAEPSASQPAEAEAAAARPAAPCPRLIDRLSDYGKA